MTYRHFRKHIFLAMCVIVCAYVLYGYSGLNFAFGRDVEVLYAVNQMLHERDVSSYGGLALCPGVHDFFAKVSTDSQNICEIGMGTGISTVIFLQSASRALVHEFDLGDSNKRKIAKYLNDHFGERLVPHWGDFHVEIPRAAPICDLIYVDALHPDDVQLAMKYLGGESADWLYHDGGAGVQTARQYLLRELGIGVK